jgi:hypothetical protein
MQSEWFVGFLLKDEGRKKTDGKTMWASGSFIGIHSCMIADVFSNDQDIFKRSKINVNRRIGWVNLTD